MRGKSDNHNTDFERLWSLLTQFYFMISELLSLKISFQSSIILSVKKQGQGWAICSAKSQEPGDYHFKAQVKKFTINAFLIVPPQFRCQGAGTLIQQP